MAFFFFTDMLLSQRFGDLAVRTGENPKCNYGIPSHIKGSTRDIAPAYDVARVRRESEGYRNL